MRLPPLRDTLRYATIAGSHSNQVLRSWYYGIEHENPNITVNGRLSMEVLERNDLAYHRAVKDGCMYDVVASCVVDEFPEFCSLSQSAANAANQVARPEAELQICCKMLGFIKNQVGDQPTPYQDIAPQILRSKPPRPECIPHLYNFMIRCGGGKSAHLFQNTESFVKSYGHSGRSFGVKAWDQPWFGCPPEGYGAVCALATCHAESNVLSPRGIGHPRRYQEELAAEGSFRQGHAIRGTAPRCQEVW